MRLELTPAIGPGSLAEQFFDVSYKRLCVEQFVLCICYVYRCENIDAI